MMTTETLADGALEAALRDLRAAAPPSVGFGALVEAGMADRYAPIETPLGQAFVAWNGRGVSWVAHGRGRRRVRATGLARSVGRPIEPADALPERLASAIRRRLDGDRRVRIPLDLRGHTPFEVTVWTKALEIPRGEVRPYGWIAAEIGRPKAVRAVGTALAHNPVPLVVPCHRVVRSDGLIGQYSMGGPEAKRRVLAAEGLDTHALEAEAARRASASPARTRRTSSATRPAATPAGSRPGIASPSRASPRRGRPAIDHASIAGRCRWRRAA